MRKLFLAVSAAVLLFSALLPTGREVDKVMAATEYALADPAYARSVTVTVRGYDCRNLFGQGYFVGTFSTPEWELSKEGWTLNALFPIPDAYCNAYALDPALQPVTTDVLTLLPERSWESFLVLLQEVTDEADGKRVASFDHRSGHFLVSGALPREEALALARQLSRGTALSPLFASAQ